MPLVYSHLREVAASYIRRERNPDLLQATVLVHELYLRLLNQKKADWEDRRHFYTFAAKVMRMILIDHARECLTQLRGGGFERVPLSDDLAWINIDSAELLDLSRALDELEALDAQKVRMVELRYFLGCTAEETADLNATTTQAIPASFTNCTIHRGAYFFKFPFEFGSLADFSCGDFESLLRDQSRFHLLLDVLAQMNFQFLQRLGSFDSGSQHLPPPV